MMGRRGPGLIRGVARTAAIAGTATAVSGRVARRQHQRWSEQEAEQYAEPPAEAPPAAAPPPGPAEPDYMAEIERLAQLRNQGLITPDEFEAKKKQLLGI
jgi:hypothetical protein